MSTEDKITEQGLVVTTQEDLRRLVYETRLHCVTRFIDEQTADALITKVLGNCYDK